MTLSPSDLGLLAALGTAVLWAFTAMLFTAAARRLGATTTNAARVSLALVLLGAVNLGRTGQLLPDLQPTQWRDLALSGVIGLALCDQALFLAFALIGPRQVMLVQTTTPLFGLALGFVLLGETVGMAATGGVAVTLLGVAWVVSERGSGGRPHPLIGRGLTLAVVAAALQALGALLSKRGMGHGSLAPEARLDPLAATYLRMLFGTLGVLPLVALASWRRRRERAAGKPERERPERASLRRGWQCLVAATVLGPVLGVWLSLEAFDRVEVGLAQTLIGLSPVVILPLVALGGERISGRALVGALMAVAGTALLFLS